MVMEEIYLLTKHANFDAKYVENIPVYKRRFHLNLLRQEFEEKKKAEEAAIRKNKTPTKRGRR